MHKIKSYQLITLSISFIFFITLLIPLLLSYFYFDPSLSLRLEHWKNFYEFTTISNLFVPFLNPYRSEVDFGTFHNEFLDPYSYFGILIFFIFGLVTLLINNLDHKTKAAMIPFFVVLTLGMVIQNNYSQPYTVVIIFFLLGLFSKNRLENENEEY